MYIYIYLPRCCAPHTFIGNDFNFYKLKKKKKKTRAHTMIRVRIAKPVRRKVSERERARRSGDGQTDGQTSYIIRTYIRSRKCAYNVCVCVCVCMYINTLYRRRKILYYNSNRLCTFDFIHKNLSTFPHPFYSAERRSPPRDLVTLSPVPTPHHVVAHLAGTADTEYR